MIQVNEEMDRVLMGGRWKWLLQQSKGSVTYHTVNVVYQTVCHPIYLHHCTAEERNILKWAALLHDISKRQSPLITGKDHIHPFISAATTLEIMCDMGILKPKNSIH